MRRTRRGRKTSTGFKRIYALKKSAVVCIFYTCGFGFSSFYFDLVHLSSTIRLFDAVLFFVFYY